MAASRSSGRVNGRVERRDVLSEAAIWSTHGTAVWQADRFSGSPCFYPVYRYRDYYSYSPLALIRLKGGLHLNSRAATRVSGPDFRFYSGADTIDRDIVRIGGPPVPGFRTVDKAEHVESLAEAMCSDIADVEAAHPGYTNVLLCGGKDSLNMTLLPWTNPVIVASAPPNHALVRSFLEGNDLAFDLVRLDDSDESLLQTEILVNCCRNDLQHCRWAPQLKRLAESLEGRVIYWKGQLGNIIQTRYWMRFAYKYSRLKGALAVPAARPVRYVLRKMGATQRMAFENLWTVGAMWQGAHNAILREISGALVLSAYHGPAARAVWTHADFDRVVREDIRPMVGKYLRGDVVAYPAKNPGPPRSGFRKGLSGVRPFLEATEAAGIPIHR
jgi:hypothetical protein